VNVFQRGASDGTQIEVQADIHGIQKASLAIMKTINAPASIMSATATSKKGELDLDLED
jgi:hypothetical protein